MKRRTFIVPILLLAFCCVELQAGGGPWAVKPGKPRVTFGFSRKVAGTLWRNGILEEPHDSTLVDGHFHDFQYAYLMPEIGIIDGLEFSALITYLWGYERVFETDPVTKARHPVEELNQGFSDMWLNLKYQFLEGEYPMAIQVSSRFPDLYTEGGPYTRYVTRVTSREVVTRVNDSSRVVTVRDTANVPSPEWRGLLKRDLGVHLLAGHSFGSDGYVQGELAYNFRRDAFADQMIFAVSGGYNYPVNDMITLSPKLAFDYTGGLGNGAVPDSTDRFRFTTPQDVPGTNLKVATPTANYYFNNGRYGRLYGSVGIGYNSKYNLELGAGRWLFGNGSAVYTELYAQVTASF